MVGDAGPVRKPGGNGGSWSIVYSSPPVYPPTSALLARSVTVGDDTTSRRSVPLPATDVTVTV